MLAIVVAFLGQSEAETRQARRPHIVEAPHQTFHKKQH